MSLAVDVFCVMLLSSHLFFTIKGEIEEERCEDLYFPSVQNIV
jgi:hypothetical protein